MATLLESGSVGSINVEIIEAILLPLLVPLLISYLLPFAECTHEK
jgi:hypothetical protein